MFDQNDKQELMPQKYMSTSKWFYTINGKDKPKATWTELIDLFSSGEINNKVETFVYVIYYDTYSIIHFNIIFSDVCLAQKVLQTMDAYRRITRHDKNAIING